MAPNHTTLMPVHTSTRAAACVCARTHACIPKGIKCGRSTTHLHVGDTEEAGNIVERRSGAAVFKAHHNCRARRAARRMLHCGHVLQCRLHACCHLTMECVLLPQNAFCHYRIHSVTVECTQHAYAGGCCIAVTSCTAACRYVHDMHVRAQCVYICDMCVCMTHTGHLRKML